MTLKPYFVTEIKEDSEGNTQVRIQYRAKQSGAGPANANPTGFTGTLAQAPVAEDLDQDGDGFKNVLLTYTGSPTINTAYLDDESSFNRN